jgi:chromosome segregation ATPase
MLWRGAGTSAALAPRPKRQRGSSAGGQARRAHSADRASSPLSPETSEDGERARAVTPAEEEAAVGMAARVSTFEAQLQQANQRRRDAEDKSEALEAAAAEAAAARQQLEERRAALALELQQMQAELYEEKRRRRDAEAKSEALEAAAAEATEAAKELQQVQASSGAGAAHRSGMRRRLRA